MKGLQVMLYERHNHIHQPQDQMIPPQVNLLQTSEVFPWLRQVQGGVRSSVDLLKYKKKTDDNY